MANCDGYQNVWVYIESEDGAAKSVGLELLAAGKRLASGLRQKLAAVVIGADIGAVVQQAASYGADEVVAVDGAAYRRYTAEAFVYAFETLARKYKPSVILIGATSNGREMAPRLSCRLATGLTADCTALDIDAQSGCVAWTRPAFGGNLMAAILCPESRPQMGTVRPGVFKKAAPVLGKGVPVMREDIAVPSGIIKTELVEAVTAAAREAVNLEDAAIIVAGGRGVGSAENFSYIRDLAEALGGAVAASRAAVDAGWLDHVYQVGQTGKTVQPALYVACGISGAVQHLAGMSAARAVVAVNNDPDAPIFAAADYGIVGNLFEIIPPLAREIRRMSVCP